METLIQSIIKALGWSLIHSLWQGALIYGILFLIFLLAPKLSAIAKHNLSFAAICTMCGWFFITFIQKIHFSANAVNYLFFESGSTSVVFNSSPRTSFFSTTESWFPFLSIAYLLGLIIQLFIFWKGFSMVQKLRKTQLQSVPFEWQIIFDKVVLNLNIRRKINFKLSTLAKVPMVIGYLKPMVLFPVQLFNHLDAQQTEAILIHELSHIKRNDFLLNLIQTFIETILFFNPFVWMVGRYIKIEREHACDDRVIQFTGKRVSYAEALLQLEIIKTGTSPNYAMAATHKKQHLLERIKRITLLKTNYMNVKQQLTTLAIILLAIVSVAWLIPTNNTKGIKNVSLNSSINKISKASIFPNFNNITQKNSSLSDTIPLKEKKKQHIQIVVTDSSGNTTTYPSFKDLPDSVKKEMSFNRNFKINMDSFHFQMPPNIDLKGKFQFPNLNIEEWAKWGKEIAANFNSEEFKQKQKELMEKFNSPEFQQKQKEIMENFNSPKFKQKQKELMDKLNSPEFKKKQQIIIDKLGDLNMGDFSFNADSIFFDRGNVIIFKNDSKEKQNEEYKNSKEYKKLKEKFDKEVEKLKKKSDKEV